MQKRTYLTITPDDKKEALRAAGRLADGGYPLEYDRSQKLWFAKPDADLEKVKAWLPEQAATGQHQNVANNLMPAEEFALTLTEAGFILPDSGLPEMDGRRHRVATEGDKAGSKSGVYQGFLDGRPAGWYQNHRASEGKVNWTSTGAYQYDPAEAMKQKALAAQKRWDREMQSQHDFAVIAKRLTGQWSKMPAATDDHAYLTRKGVPALDGVKLDKYDNLVIPLRNTDGDIRTLQYISADGTKNLKKDAEKTGNFFVVGGALSAERPVLYAEGYATAASLHLATGIPVVMTVDAGNMVTVSQKLKTLYPDAPHIILGEDDFTRADNKGLNKAKEAAEAINGVYLIPQFTDSERAQAVAGSASFSDFNDIHTSRGLDAVRDQLASVLDPHLPDWRQILTEDITMPDTNNRQDLPTDETQLSQEDHDNYAAYLQASNPRTASPEDTGQPADILPEEPQQAADATPVIAENRPEQDTNDATVQSDADIIVADSPLPPETAEPAITGTSPLTGDDSSADMTVNAAETVTATTDADPVMTDAALLDDSLNAGPPLPEADPEAEPPVIAEARPEVKQETPQAEHGDPVLTDPQTAAQAEENGFSFTFGRQPGDVSPQEPSVSPIDLDALLQGLSSRQEGSTWIYALDGEDAFRDYGDRIVMATPQASENDRMILSALLSAKANQRGAVEITGSDAFIQRTLSLIADHKVEVHLKNPHQRAQFEALLKARAEQANPQDGLNITPAQTDTVAGPAPASPQAPVAPEGAAPAASAPVAAAPAQPQPPAPELTVIEKETLRTGLTGKLLEAGKAPYQFDKTNTDSFYVELRTKTGNKTYWGVELEQALNDSGRQVGDMVKLQYLGKKAVTVNVPQKDKNGVVTGFTPLDTHRNHWTITPAMDNRLLVEDSRSVAPADLAAYDGNAFWQLQQHVVQAASLPLAAPGSSGHGLLYTGPDGKGHPAPDVPPANAPVPPQSKAAGSVVMQAFTPEGEPLAHLVKGHGDYLQGVIRHEGELQHVLARLCTGNSGNTWLALNAVRDNGAMELIGHATAVNAVKNGVACFDTFAFQMKGEDAPKFAVPLVTPEKIPPALHSKLGFTQAYTPPKAEDDVPQAPRAQAKPAQPQPM